MLPATPKDVFFPIEAAMARPEDDAEMLLAVIV
jgi:hypothetical protein